MMLNEVTEVGQCGQGPTVQIKSIRQFMEFMQMYSSFRAVNTNLSTVHLYLLEADNVDIYRSKLSRAPVDGQTNYTSK